MYDFGTNKNGWISMSTIKVASNWPRRYLALHPICPTTGTMTVPSFKPLKPMQIDFQPKYGMSGLFERCGWWCHSFTPSSFTRLHVGANGETNGGTEPTQCRVQGTWWKCDFNIYTYYLHLCKQVSQLKVYLIFQCPLGLVIQKVWGISC